MFNGRTIIKHAGWQLRCDRISTCVDDATLLIVRKLGLDPRDALRQKGIVERVPFFKVVQIHICEDQRICCLGMIADPSMLGFGRGRKGIKEVMPAFCPCRLESANARGPLR